jgi:hypothetical protein
MKQQTRWILIVVLILGLASLACNALQGDDEPSGDVVTTEPSGDQAVDGDTGQLGDADSTGSGDTSGDGQSEVPESGEDTSSSAPETLSLNADNAFGQPIDVDSFQFSMAFTFEETLDDGTVNVGSVSGEGARIADPEAMTMVLTTEGVGSIPIGGTFTFTQIGDMDYMSLPTGCVTGITGQTENPFSSMLDDGGVLGELEGATLVETNVEMNGVNTNHYTFDESLLALNDPTAGELSAAEGNIWVAADGGYVVRILMEGVGSTGLLGDVSGTKGQMSYELNYFGFNEPVEINPPPGCDGEGEGEFPIMEGAQNLTSIAGVQTYTTDQPFDTVVDFYKNEMAAAGWSPEIETVSENLASLNYTKDGQNVQINVLEDLTSGGFLVAIVPQ